MYIYVLIANGVSGFLLVELSSNINSIVYNLCLVRHVFRGNV